MAMIAITTSSSIRVKAAGLGHRIPFAFPLDSCGGLDVRRPARDVNGVFIIPSYYPQSAVRN
jgi:hypothetical protein